MTMNQEIQKKKKKNRREKKSFKICKKLQNARKDIKDLFEKGIFPYRGNVFKTKKNQKKTNFSNISRMVSTMICLKSILILNHLFS